MKENQNTEWKESWPDEYFKWICGFASTDRGVLFIGKDDKGNVVGLTPDSVKHHIDQLRKAGRVRHVGPTKAGQWEVQG
jgi:ATP-dependent DNA helicase RecG